MQHCRKWFRGQQKIKGIFFILVCGNTEFILGMKRLQKASTVEPRLTATSAIWSPRYYSHFFAAWQEDHAFSCNKDCR